MQLSTNLVSRAQDVLAEGQLCFWTIGPTQERIQSEHQYRLWNYSKDHPEKKISLSSQKIYSEFNS